MDGYKLRFKQLEKELKNQLNMDFKGNLEKREKCQEFLKDVTKNLDDIKSKE